MIGFLCDYTTTVIKRHSMYSLPATKGDQTMRKMISTLVLGMILSAGGYQANAADLKVGDAAPEFTLKGSDGKTYKLSSFKGKQAVVLAWFPKAFTGG